MKTRMKLISAAIIAASGTYTHNAMAVLPNDALLTISSGTPVFDTYGNQSDVTSGSYFGMDLSGNSKIGGTEKTVLEQGTIGIRIGAETSAGASHTGAITAGDTNQLDAPWEFSSNTGSGQFVPGSGGPTETSPGSNQLDWTGFVINWNGTIIDMGGGTLWAPQNCAVLGCDDVTLSQGVASLEWSGVFGDPYILHYAAVVPTGSFTGTQYYLHFEGTVLAPPNDPPVANSFITSGLSNQTLDINILANSFDPDGNIDPTTVVTSNSTACAVIIDNDDGTLTFPACPTAQYTFDYTISDTVGAASNTATVTVNISANPPPNTTVDSATTDGTTPVVIDVLANDTDDTGLDPSTVTIPSNPTDGSITDINPTTGAVTYAANSGFSGVDTFTYTVEDDSGTNNVSPETSVVVAVNAFNIPSSDATLAPGATAQSVGSTSGIVTIQEIGVPDTGSSPEQGVTNSCIGGCFDFIISGFTGTEARAVLPLSVPIPTPADGETLSYRKLASTGWQGFEFTGNNLIHTAPGTFANPDITCPPAADGSYDLNPGLTIGHQCVRLTITDNTGAGDGPNDSNATAGTIADPGGIATTVINDTRASGSEGCSISGGNRSSSSLAHHMEWLLVAGFIAFIGMIRRKRKPGHG